VEIGSEKFSAVVTDNPNVMKAVWKIIEERYPTIAAYGCAAHGVNLLIKDIAHLPEHANTIKESTKIIQFVKNHHQSFAMFEEKRKEAGVNRRLSTSVPTRWMSEHEQALNLFNAKVVLTRMSMENYAELVKINPRHNSERALELLRKIK
jgi:Protein of unknown function (DUF 659)